MCDKLARGYAACTTEPATVDAVTITEKGTIDPLAPESKRRLRQRENTEAIGGMRSPHMSLRKLPGWKGVGDTLRRTLDEVIWRRWNECSEVVGKLGEE